MRNKKEYQPGCHTKLQEQLANKVHNVVRTWKARQTGTA